MPSLAAHRLEAIFDRTFGPGVVLRGGFAEPEYVPPQAGKPAEVRYTHDYFASALHEVAHWALAGAARRAQHDYGYWYIPGPRTAADQAAFYAAEVRPQALEWLFSLACRAPFRLSIDNFEAGESWQPFACSVRAAAVDLLRAPPARARAYLDALAAEFGGSPLPAREHLESARLAP